MPGTEEQEGSRIRVIRLEGVTHSDMGEKGPEKQHVLINRHVLDSFGNLRMARSMA